MGRSYKLFLIPVLGFLLIMLASALFKRIPPKVTPTDFTQMAGYTSTPGGEFIAEHSQVPNCGEEGMVIDAIVTINISGGVPPYHVEFNTDQPILDIKETGIQFTLPGGSGVTATAFDSAEVPNRKIIDVYVSRYLDECNTPTPTYTAAATPTSTHTSTPTPTSTRHPTYKPTATGTKGPKPNPATATQFQTPTNTSGGPGYGTPTPAPTDKPTSTPTNKPAATPTDKPTSTPTSAPTSKHNECNDGRDNDNDGKIDLEDAQCENKGDKDESS